MISPEYTKLNRNGWWKGMVLGARGCPLFVSQTLPRFLFSPIFFEQSFGLGTNVNCQLSFKEHMCRKGWKISTCLEVVSYRDKRGAVLQIDAMFLMVFLTRSPTLKGCERVRSYFSVIGGWRLVDSIPLFHYRPKKTRFHFLFRSRMLDP